MPSKIQFAINPKIPIIASGSIRIPIPIHPHITQYSFFTISISFGSGCGAVILLACSVSSSCSSSTSFPICLKAALISSHNFFNVSPPNSLIKSVALSTVGSSFSISLLPHILGPFQQELPLYLTSGKSRLHLAYNLHWFHSNIDS